MIAFPAAAGVSLDSPPRWFDELPLAARLVLAFAVEDPGALGRIIGVVAERGPLAPNEIVRLAVAGKDCIPLSGGAL